MGAVVVLLDYVGGGATGSPLPQDIEATSISDVPGCAASGM